MRINSTSGVRPVVFVPPLLGVHLTFIVVCTIGALGPGHGVPLVAKSFSLILVLLLRANWVPLAAPA